MTPHLWGFLAVAAVVAPLLGICIEQLITHENLIALDADKQ